MNGQRHEFPSPSSSAPSSGAEPVSSEGGRRPTEEDTGASEPLPQRWSARRKAEIALRLLRGKSLDALARETKQLAGKLAEWRDAFLAGGEQGMKSRAGDPEHEEREAEREGLLTKIGKQAMEIELLYKRCDKLEEGLPLGLRRSRR